MIKVMEKSLATVESRSRGRPKSEEKREAIYRSATELFLTNGYDGVSMDQVAECAGVSKQTVYSHFDSKEALFADCVRNRCVAHSVGTDLLDAARPVGETLRSFAHHFSQLLLSEEAIRLKRLLCAQAEANPRLSELFYEAGPQAIKDSLERYLNSQVAAGKLQIDDVPTACRQLVYMVQGERVMRQLMNVPGGPDHDQHERYVDQCVDLFLSAYGAA